MATATRNDVHRPSAIEPADYYFVALGYQKCDGLEDVYAISVNQARLRAHMERTGAKFSNHAHGGNCHICGAYCIYTAIFHHVPTNTLIETGMDCAEKMDMGDAVEFRTFRDACLAAEHNRAGKLKAQHVLSERGLSRAWELSCLDKDPTTEPPRECRHCTYGCEKCDGTGWVGNSWQTLRGIVGNLVRYGELSEKQFEFLATLVDRVDNYERLKAEQDAERERERLAAEDCPTGKVKVTGEVISTKVQDGQYGPQYKMLVKDDRGFKVWGSIPSSLQLFDYWEEHPVEAGELARMRGIHGDNVVERDNGFVVRVQHQRALDRGDRVRFTASVEPSKDDAKFGFYKRPSKASLAE
jgi:hypothetical protein